MLKIVTVKDDRLFFIDLLEKQLTRELVEETLKYRRVLTNLEDGPFCTIKHLKNKPEKFRLVPLLEELEELEQPQIANISVVLESAYQYYNSHMFLSRRNRLFRYLVSKYKNRINFIVSAQKLGNVDKSIRTQEHVHTEV